MAVDFSSLLKKPTGTAKRPPTLPAGLYPGIVTKYEFAELFGAQKTPGVRFMLTPREWPEAISLEERDGIDLSKRQLRKEYSILEADIWQLQAFLASLGLNDGTSTDEENIPKAVGKSVLIDVIQRVNPKSPDGELLNNVGKVVGAE